MHLADFALCCVVLAALTFTTTAGADAPSRPRFVPPRLRDYIKPTSGPLVDWQSDAGPNVLFGAPNLGLRHRVTHVAELQIAQVYGSAHPIDTASTDVRTRWDSLGSIWIALFGEDEPELVQHFLDATSGMYNGRAPTDPIPGAFRLPQQQHAYETAPAVAPSAVPLNLTQRRQQSPVLFGPHMPRPAWAQGPHWVISGVQQDGLVQFAATGELAAPDPAPSDAARGTIRMRAGSIVARKCGRGVGVDTWYTVDGADALHALRHPERLRTVPSHVMDAPRAALDMDETIEGDVVFGHLMFGQNLLDRLVKFPQDVESGVPDYPMMHLAVIRAHVAPYLSMSHLFHRDPAVFESVVDTAPYPVPDPALEAHRRTGFTFAPRPLQGDVCAARARLHAQCHNERSHSAARTVDATLAETCHPTGPRLQHAIHQKIHIMEHHPHFSAAAHHWHLSARSERTLSEARRDDDL